jgi:divalent metal cation (Fe/Co/Zn/Cd) transporter
VSDEERALCDHIRAVLRSDPRVLDCSEITLLKFGQAYNLTVSCHVDKTKTLDEVHSIIADVESRLYQQFKQLRRITIHAEPI